MIKVSVTAMLTLLLSLACGGGGGGGDSSSLLFTQYSGQKSKAELDEESMRIFFDQFWGGPANNTLLNKSNNFDDDYSVFNLIRLVILDHNNSIIRRKSSLEGNFSGAVEVQDKTNEFGLGDITLEFDSYSDDGFNTLDGSAKMTIKEYDESGVPAKFLINYDGLRITNGSANINISGELNLNMGSNSEITSVEMNLLVNNNLNNKSSFLSLSYEEKNIGVGILVEISGKYYFDNLGYVDVRVDEDLEYSTASQVYPDKGQMSFDGKSDATVLVKFISETNAQLELDKTGDGIFDSLESLNLENSSINYSSVFSNDNDNIFDVNSNQTQDSVEMHYSVISQQWNSFNRSETNSISGQMSGLTVIQNSSLKSTVLAVKTGSTSLPEFLLALKGGQPNGGNLTGAFNAAIFGDQNNEKAALQTIVDFANPNSPSITRQGMSASSADFASELSELANASFSISSDGTATWGDYKGVVTGDGDKFLLSHLSKAIFILASKRENITAIASSTTLTGGLLAQNLKDSSKALSSGKVSVVIDGSNLTISFGTEDVATSGDPIDSGVVPTRDFAYVAGSDNSELEIYADGSTTDIREQGFMSDEFVVIVNPNTVQAPYIIIAPY